MRTEVRRQAIAAARPETTGPLRLDPAALPARYSASLAGGAPATILLDHDKATVRRTVSTGVSMMLTLPMATFRGVAVRMESAGVTGAIRVHLELVHPDPALTLPLAVSDDPEDVLVDWQRWSKALGLPLLLVELDGRVSEPVPRLGKVAVSPAKPRRRSTVLTGRRTRFARRRRIGDAARLGHRVEGDEIIARN